MCNNAILTDGGSGTGSDNSDVELSSLVYHQSKNCRKNTPTDKPVDNVTAVMFSPFFNKIFIFWLALKFTKNVTSFQFNRQKQQESSN